MEIIFIITTFFISFFVGFYCSYRPCNHSWKLLEQHKGTRGGNWEWIKSIYICDKCGKIKTLDF